MTPFEKLVDNFLQERWKHSPLLATVEGCHSYDDRLDSLHEDSIQERLQVLRRQVEALESYSPTSPSEEMEGRAMKGECRSEIVELEQIEPWRTDPSLGVNLGLQSLYLLMVRDFAPIEERAESILSRMERFPKLLDEAMIALREPAPVFLEVAEGVLQGAKLFLREIPEEIGKQVPHLKRFLRTTADHVVSALNRYDHFLKVAVRVGPERGYAIGSDAFQALLRDRHHLEQNAGELVEIAEESAVQVEEELERIARKIEPNTTSWRELISKLKRDHPDAGTLLQAYREEMERARRFCLDRDLVTFPKSVSLEIVPTPVFERPTTPYAALMPPAPFDEKQTSYFYVTPVDPSMSPEEQEERLQGHSYWSLPVTALHEAFPGHHLQLTIANRLPSKLRRVLGTPLLWEGWALYCEEMMYEEGFYTDPRVRFFQLKDLLWRACRVRVDVGLHTEGWDVERAIRLMVERAGLEPAHARSEVWRYCGTPTQPMSYLIGRREILALREEVQKEEGADFSLKRFHDRLLAFGSFSPALTRKYWRQVLLDPQHQNTPPHLLAEKGGVRGYTQDAKSDHP